MMIYVNVQEDVPDEFANLVLNFISRNRIGPNGVQVCVIVVSLCLKLLLLKSLIKESFVLQIPGMWKPSQQPKT